MRIRFEMTRWLAELTGHEALAVELQQGASVADALRTFATSIDGKGRERIVVNGGLHGSVLVVLNGEPCVDPEQVRLSGGETIRLLLPVAGG